MDADQIKKLYSDYLGSQAGEISIVGDFDPDTRRSRFEEMLDRWTLVASRMPASRGCSFPTSREATTMIVTPDKANAVYVAGMTFPMKDDDPDYPALVMGNYILGGGSLSSRLGDRVRQKEGLSYGVGSAIVGRRARPSQQHDAVRHLQPGRDQEG